MLTHTIEQSTPSMDLCSLNAIPLEKGRSSHLRDLFSGQVHELYVAEQQLVKGGNMIALVMAFLLLAAGSAFFAQQSTLGHYQKLLNQRAEISLAIQSNLTEVTKERDVAVDYINSLQTHLADVIRERNAALGEHLPEKGTLDVNP